MREALTALSASNGEESSAPLLPVEHHALQVGWVWMDV
jgi:hypothetical protein